MDIKKGQGGRGSGGSPFCPALSCTASEAEAKIHLRVYIVRNHQSRGLHRQPSFALTFPTGPPPVPFCPDHFYQLCCRRQPRSASTFLTRPPPAPCAPTFLACCAAAASPPSSYPCNDSALSRNAPMSRPAVTAAPVRRHYSRGCVDAPLAVFFLASAHLDDCAADMLAPAPLFV